MIWYITSFIAGFWIGRIWQYTSQFFPCTIIISKDGSGLGVANQTNSHNP